MPVNIVNSKLSEDLVLHIWGDIYAFLFIVLLDIIVYPSQLMLECIMTLNVSGVLMLQMAYTTCCARSSAVCLHLLQTYFLSILCQQAIDKQISEACQVLYLMLHQKIFQSSSLPWKICTPLLFFIRYKLPALQFHHLCDRSPAEL